MILIRTGTFNGLSAANDFRRMQLTIYLKRSCFFKEKTLPEKAEQCSGTLRYPIWSKTRKETAQWINAKSVLLSNRTVSVRRSSQLLSCTVDARTGAVHIASSADDSPIEDGHVAAAYGLGASELIHASHASHVRRALRCLIQPGMDLEEPDARMTHTIGCIDTAGRPLTG